MGPDVPDLCVAIADRSEGSWKGILLWFVSSGLLHGEGSYSAAAGAGQGGRPEGAPDDPMGRDDASLGRRGRGAVFHSGAIYAVAAVTAGIGGLPLQRHGLHRGSRCAMATWAGMGSRWYV